MLSILSKGSRSNKTQNSFGRNMKYRLRALSATILVLALLLTMTSSLFAAEPGQTIYMAFTSDVHEQTGNLGTWLGNIKTEVDELDVMVFGGDYQNAYLTEDTGVRACLTKVAETYPTVPCVLVRGNHDLNIADTNHELFKTGLVRETDYYDIYVLNSSSQSFLTDEIDDLDTYLAQVAGKKPVFVASHIPLHYFSGRTSGNANALLDVLNEHSNVIFLWGHNHSQNDTNYGKTMASGDTIQTASNAAAKTINFTYLSYGAMKEGANKDCYGLLATLQIGVGQIGIHFAYKNLSGTTVAEHGPKDFEVKSAIPAGAAFKPVAAPEDGKSYLVVVEFEGAYYAMTNAKYESGGDPPSFYLKGTPVTITGGNIAATPELGNYLLLFQASGGGFIISQEGRFVQRAGTKGLALDVAGESDRTWLYDNSGSTPYLRTVVSEGSSAYLTITKSSTTPVVYRIGAPTDGSKKAVYLYELAEGNQEPEEPGGPTIYKLANVPESGETYVVVAEHEDKYYALTTEKYTSGSTDYLKAVAVTLSASKEQVLPPVGENSLWDFTTSRAGFTLANAGQLLTRKSSANPGVYLQNTETKDSYVDWIHNAEEHSLKTYSSQASSNKDFFLLVEEKDGVFYFRNSGDGSQGGTNAKSTIYLYKVGEGEESEATLESISATINQGGTLVYPHTSLDNLKDLLTVTAHYSDGSTSVLAKSQYTLSGSLAVGVSTITVTHATENKNTTVNVNVSETQTEPEPVTVYELVAAPENGETYLIVAEEGEEDKEYYALSAVKHTLDEKDYLKGTLVTLSDTKEYVLAPVDDNCLWDFTTSGNGYNVMQESQFLNRKEQANQGIYLKNESAGAGYADWIYNEDEHSLQTYSTQDIDNKDFYLLLEQDGQVYYFANSGDGSSGGTDTKSVIYLYKVGEGEPVSITGISAVIEQGETLVYPDTEWDDIKALLTVTVHYSNEGTAVLSASDYSLSGTLAVGNSPVTVTHNASGKTATVEVNVSDESGKTLTGISITKQPNKTSYTAGQSFSPTGMEVTAHYSDESSEVVNSYTYSPSGALATSHKQITVSYGGKTATVAITVQSGGGGGTVTPPVTPVTPVTPTPDPEVVEIDDDETPGAPAALKLYTVIGSRSYLLDDEEHAFDNVTSYRANPDTTVMAIRLLESLGANIHYVQENGVGIVTVRYGEITAVLTEKSTTMIVLDGDETRQVSMRTVFTNLGGRTYLPTRDVAQNLGFSVVWQQADDSITIQAR